MSTLEDQGRTQDQVPPVDDAEAAAGPAARRLRERDVEAGQLAGAGLRWLDAGGEGIRTGAAVERVRREGDRGDLQDTGGAGPDLSRLLRPARRRPAPRLPTTHESFINLIFHNIYFL